LILDYGKKLFLSGIRHPASSIQHLVSSNLLSKQPEDKREQQTDYYHRCDGNVEFKIRLINYDVAWQLSYGQLD